MSRKRILYVDDDQALCDTVRETLERAGYEVVADTDTQRVLRAFSKEPESCDLAILDYLMPQMKGLELAEWLRLCRADLPVILVTGYPDLLSSKEAERAGIGEVLFKPLNAQRSLRCREPGPVDRRAGRINRGLGRIRRLPGKRGERGDRPFGTMERGVKTDGRRTTALRARTMDEKGHRETERIAKVEKNDRPPSPYPLPSPRAREKSNIPGVPLATSRGAAPLQLLLVCTSYEGRSRALF